MPVHRGAFGGAVNLRPIVAIGGADQNQNACLVSGSVTAMGASTTVDIQYSTDSSFATYSSVEAYPYTITGFTQTAVSATITGLSTETTYYFRISATNSIGTTISSSLSRKTWGLYQYANGTPGTHTVSLPVGANQPPQLVDVFILGSGGGAGYAGGGGGGYRLRSTWSFSQAIGVVTVVIGSGGSPVGGAGASSYIVGTNPVNGTYLPQLLAGGGGGGGTGYGSSGGSVGSGDNPGYSGGTGAAVYNKDGSILEHANGGGAGISNNGGNSYGSANTQYGGTGGNGGTAYGWSGGAGGGGYGSIGTGSNGAYHSIYGSGGQGINSAGANGLVVFKYYGPV